MKPCAVCGHAEFDHEEEGCLFLAAGEFQFCKCDEFVSDLDAVLADSVMASAPGIQ